MAGAGLDLPGGPELRGSGSGEIGTGDPAFTVVIPARIGSTRLPRKVLRPLAGQPLLWHVWQRALESGAARVLIATDSEEVALVAEDFGAEFMLTQAEHASGSDRVAEVVRRLDLPDEAIVVNLQGDEPLMPPALLAQVARLAARHAGWATLCWPIVDADQWLDPHVVKVVPDAQGRALYFSRAPIPWERDALEVEEAREPRAWRHIGLYAWPVAVLQRFVSLPLAPLEQLEKLEQLRGLWHGLPIWVEAAVQEPPPGVDTERDFERVLGRMLAAEG